MRIGRVAVAPEQRSMGPSKQYRVWRFIAASPHPVNRATIAIGSGLTEESVASIIWHLQHRAKAIRKIVSQRGAWGAPTWVALPDVEIPRGERSK
jgi:hypothetical protein